MQCLEKFAGTRTIGVIDDVVTVENSARLGPAKSQSDAPRVFRSIANHQIVSPAPKNSLKYACWLSITCLAQIRAK